jgi:hypothetical protein
MQKFPSYVVFLTLFHELCQKVTIVFLRQLQWNLVTGIMVITNTFSVPNDVVIIAIFTFVTNHNYNEHVTLVPSMIVVTEFECNSINVNLWD